MTWLLWALGGVAASFAIVTVAGALLPVAHVASRQVRLRRPVAEVWETVAAVLSYPEWRPGVERIELLPAETGLFTWREHTRHGAIVYEVVEEAPPVRRVVRIASKGLPYGGTWTWDLAPAEGGTVVTITERGEVYNPIFRALARFVFGQDATINHVLRALARRLGEDAQLDEEST